MSLCILLRYILYLLRNRYRFSSAIILIVFGLKFPISARKWVTPVFSSWLGLCQVRWLVRCGILQSIPKLSYLRSTCNVSCSLFPFCYTGRPYRVEPTPVLSINSTNRHWSVEKLTVSYCSAECLLHLTCTFC